MHIQTHLMSGWCIANLVPSLTPRERFFAMIAASLADLDGLSIIGGMKSYREWHHVLGHNVGFAAIFCFILTLLSTHRLRAFLLYFGLAHLHLILDYLGSGPLWKIYYGWPFSHRYVLTPADAWEFSSWQNTTFAAAFLAWTIGIAFVRRRTPLEAIMPALDRQLVGLPRLSSTAPSIQ